MGLRPLLRCAVALLLICGISAAPGHADCASGDGNITSPGLCTTPQTLTGQSGSVVAGATLSTGPGTTAYTISSNNSTVTNSGIVSSAGPTTVLMSGNGNPPFPTTGFTATLINSGSITGAAGGTAILVNPAQALNITNTGTIVGSAGGLAIGYVQALNISSGTINQVAGAITGGMTFSGVLNVMGGVINGPINGQTTIPSGAAGSSFNTSNLGSVVFDLGDGSFTTAGSISVGLATVKTGTLTLQNDIDGRLINNATLRISGARTVTRGFTQNATGTLVMPISPQGSALLTVPSRFNGANFNPGRAVIGGTLALDYAPGTYTPRSYTLISVGGVNGGPGNLSGMFSAITGTAPTPGLTQSVVVGPDSVDLVLSGPTNNTVFSAATSLLALQGQAATRALLDRWGAADADAALSFRTGRIPARVQVASVDRSGSAALAEALPEAVAPYGGWVRGIGNFTSVGGTAAAPGFTARNGGFLAGIDRLIDDGMWLGAAASYSHTDFAESGSANGDIDTAGIALYGGKWLGPAVLTGVARYAYDRISTARVLTGAGTAREGHDGHEFATGMQAALPLDMAGIAVTPKAGLQFLHLLETGFAESGADGFNLTNSGSDTNSLQPYIAVSAKRPFTTDDGTLMTPELRLGYGREMLQNTRRLSLTLDGTAFVASGVRPSKNMLSAGIGIDIRARPDIVLFASYDALVPVGNTEEHTVAAGLRIKF